MGSDYSSLPLGDDLADLETKIDTLQATLDAFDTKLSDISHCYDESDDTLIADTGEYSTSSSTYQTIIDFLIPELVHPNSLFKIKMDVKANCNANTCYVAGYLDDTLIFELTDIGNDIHNIWKAVEETGVNGSWNTASHFYIKLKSGRTCTDPYNTVYVRNVTICGRSTPFVID